MAVWRNDHNEFHVHLGAIVIVTCTAIDAFTALLNDRESSPPVVAPKQGRSEIDTGIAGSVGDSRPGPV